MPCVMIALGLLFFTACQVTQKTQAAVESTAYLQIAQDKLGENLKYAKSENGRYVLCQTVQSSNPDNQSFKFLVYDMQDEKIVMEKSVSRGYVQWLSNTEVEIFSTPGTMRNDQSRDDFTMVYDVITGKGTPKNDWKG